MKKLVTIVLIIVMCLSLYACGQKEQIIDQSDKNDETVKTEDENKPINAKGKTPKNDLLESDLQSFLKEKNEYATITKIEVLKSLTSDESYTSTVQVFASTKYADWVYEADMQYLKYDQGWMLKDINWTASEYTLERVPDGETMGIYADQYLHNHDIYSDVWFTDYMSPVANMSVTKIDDECITFDWDAVQYLKHAQSILRFESVWKYESKTDDWSLLESKDDYEDGGFGYHLDYYIKELVIDNVDFSGIWRDEYYIEYMNDSTGKMGTIIITDYSHDGFFADVLELECGEQYYTLLDKAPDRYQVLSSGNVLWYSNGDDRYIQFSFDEDYTRIWCTSIAYWDIEIENSLPIMP